MVTEAGKELLRNTLNTAKFHNRILEENEMWKQWELEQGLTMMVSDDVILSRLNRAKKHHLCSKHRNESKSTSRERIVRENFAAGSSQSDGDRWDHSGFKELYPDESDDEIYRSPAQRDVEKKWDHSGFLELYPEEAHKERPSRSRTKEQTKKWDHGGFLELYPEEAHRMRRSRSKSKEHSKKHKKKRKHHSEPASNSDSEIWEEFKKYKRSKKLAKKSKTYDSHIKEWKMYYQKEK